MRFVSFPPRSRTPSPASSDASNSWASSPGPSTPPHLFPIHRPPMVAHLSEYPSWQAFAASPPLSPNYPAFHSAPAAEPMVDPLLEVLPSPALPPLLWDVMVHPDSIKLGSAHSPTSRWLAHADLGRCAARTSVKSSRLPLRKMVLIFPGIPLEIEVTPSAEAFWFSQPLPYVAVGDMLYGLYRALRTSIAHNELERLDPAWRESLRVAFDKRLRRDTQHHTQNLEHGIRRIDYLGERRCFLGIRPATRRELPSGRRPEETFVVELGRAS